MSFWNTSDGAQVEASSDFESEGGNLTPIPAGTGLLAVIEEAKWDDYEGDRFINLKWRVAQPAEYAKRVIFQKIRVLDDKAEKADKAKRMLAAIATNAGGGLLKLNREPLESDLMTHLSGKMMAIKVQVWETENKNGEAISGNWISAVAPAKGAPAKQEEKKAPPAAQAETDMDEDLPF